MQDKRDLIRFRIRFFINVFCQELFFRDIRYSDFHGLVFPEYISDEIILMIFVQD